jgi:hypothetical protein
MRPHDSVSQPAKPPTVGAPQPSQIRRFGIVLLKILEVGFFLATLLILDRDEALTHPLSRPILWMALLILPAATVHGAATMQQASNRKFTSVPLYYAGSVAFAVIWPVVISVFLFPDLLGTNQRIWIGVSLVILLVAGIVLVQVARSGKQAFTIQGSKWPAIMLAILIGVAGSMTLLSLLR